LPIAAARWPDLRLLTAAACIAIAACSAPGQDASSEPRTTAETRPDAAPASGPEPVAPVVEALPPPPAEPTRDTATGPTPREPWRELDRFDFAALPIDAMPPDTGHISPIAAEGEVPEGSSAERIREIESVLPSWAPGHVDDPVQRVRNYLLVLAVADYAQSPLERFLPRVVLAHMLREFRADDLAQLVCWVALHPDEGDVTAMQDPLLLALGSAHLGEVEVRHRTHYYGVKLTRWIIGW
jgi:hypothetical protein